MQRTALAAAVVIVLFATAPARATWTVTAGNWTVAKNTAGQTLDALSSNPIVVAITGDGLGLQGADLALTVEDGTVGPLLDGVDLLSGIFAGNNNGQNDLESYPTRTQLSAITTGLGNVGPNGTLAFLTIDTTGVAPGVYDLFLHYVGFGPPLDTDISGIPDQTTLLSAGTITVIPEPSSIVLALVAAAGLAAAWMRRRARKAA